MELRNQIPGVLLRSGQEMPLIGMGTATSPFPQPHRLTSILVDAIEVGYRHFDTAAHYASEEPLMLWPEASLRVEVKCSSLQSYGARTTALTSFFQ